jgi:hypothetical protein
MDRYKGVAACQAERGTASSSGSMLEAHAKEAEAKQDLMISAAISAAAAKEKSAAAAKVQDVNLVPMWTMI